MDRQSAISPFLGGLPSGPRGKNASSRKNWRILQLNRCEIGTINAPQCWVPVWWDHTIGPRTAKNGDNYCTALQRNMGRSAHGNLVQWVHLQNRRRAGSSYSHYPCCAISPAVAGCASRSCTVNTSNWPVLYQVLQFLNSPVLSAARMITNQKPKTKVILQFFPKISLLGCEMRNDQMFGTPLYPSCLLPCIVLDVSLPWYLWNIKVYDANTFKASVDATLVHYHIQFDECTCCHGTCFPKNVMMMYWFCGEYLSADECVLYIGTHWCVYPCVVLLCLVLLSWRAVRNHYPPNRSWFYPSPRPNPIHHTRHGGTPFGGWGWVVE